MSSARDRLRCARFSVDRCREPGKSLAPRDELEAPLSPVQLSAPPRSKRAGGAGPEPDDPATRLIALTKVAEPKYPTTSKPRSEDKRSEHRSACPGPKAVRNRRSWWVRTERVGSAQPPRGGRRSRTQQGYREPSIAVLGRRFDAAQSGSSANRKRDLTRSSAGLERSPQSPPATTDSRPE